jgi:hypothetical protein
MHKGGVIGVEKEKFEMTELWVRRDQTLRIRVWYLTLEWRGSVELTGLCVGACPVTSSRVQSWRTERAQLGVLDRTLKKEQDQTLREHSSPRPVNMT